MLQRHAKVRLCTHQCHTGLIVKQNAKDIVFWKCVSASFLFIMNHFIFLTDENVCCLCADGDVF